MTNGGTEWRSQGGDGGGKPWCIGKGAPYRRVAMLPAWPTAGGTGSKWPASQWTMRLWATSQRHEGKRFRQLQHHEHRAQSTYLVHSSWGGTGLEEGKEGRRGGGGKGRKKERDKVRIPNAMQSSVNSWGEAGEGASTQTQEHATRTQMQGRPPRVIGFKDSLLFAELLWATSWELLLHHCPRQYAGFEINLLKMRSLGKETPDARQSGFLSFKLLLIVIHGHCRKFRKEQRKKISGNLTIQGLPSNFSPPRYSTAVFSTKIEPHWTYQMSSCFQELIRQPESIFPTSLVFTQWQLHPFPPALLHHHLFLAGPSPLMMET